MCWRPVWGTSQSISLSMTVYLESWVHQSTHRTSRFRPESQLTPLRLVMLPRCPCRHSCARLLYRHTAAPRLSVSVFLSDTSLRRGVGSALALLAVTVFVRTFFCVGVGKSLGGRPDVSAGSRIARSRPSLTGAENFERCPTRYQVARSSVRPISVTSRIRISATCCVHA